MSVWKALRRTAFAGGALVALAVGAYVALLFFPQPVFAHVYRHGQFEVYSETSLDRRLDPIIVAATARLAHSEFYEPSSRHTVFVTGSPALQFFFNGPNGRGMARNSEIGERIFVPRLDLASGQIVHFDGRRNAAAPILAHEVTHTYVRKEVGMMASLRLPFWMREGYGEYIAYRDPSTLHSRMQTLRDATGHTIINAYGEATPRSYYEAGLLWEYLLDVRGMSARQVLHRKWNESALRSQMLTWAPSAPTRPLDTSGARTP